MTTHFLLMKDANGNVSYGLPFSLNTFGATLSAGVAQSVTVPGDANVAVFASSSGIDFYVNPTGTTTLPSGSMASRTSYLNPVIRPVVGGSTISFIASTTGDVEVSFYSSLGFGMT